MRAASLWLGALACLVTVLATAAHAEPPKSPLDHMLAAHENMTTLTADFVHETHFAGFSKARQFTGTVQVARPDRMRWDYQEGSDQQIFVNGRTVTIYMPAQNQAMVSNLTPMSDRQIPLFLLADVTRIPEVYEVLIYKTDELELIPHRRHPNGPRSVYLKIDPNSGMITRVILNLPGGNRSEIRFTNQQLDAPVEVARFNFTAPEGVHVIHTETLGPGKGK